MNKNEIAGHKKIAHTKESMLVYHVFRGRAIRRKNGNRHTTHSTLKHETHTHHLKHSKYHFLFQDFLLLGCIVQRISFTMQ